MPTQEELVKLEHEAQAEFKKYSGVVSVGFGLKRTGGKTTDQFALRVYVKEKKAESELAPEEIIPSEFKGYPTDVIKVPDVTPLHCEDMQHHSTLIGGISISNLKPDASDNYGAGTLGFFATINGVSSPENVVLVSNHHVLAANGAQAGDTIYQPRFTEVGGQVTIDLTSDQRHPVGKIHNIGQESNYNYTYAGEGAADFYVDCATAKLDFSISSWCHTKCGVHFKNEIRELNIGGNNAIDAVARVQASDLTSGNYVVYKVGRRTSRTVGRITSASMPLTNGGVNAIEIEATQNNCNGDMHFVEHGDSGSALINAQNELVGIVFGVDSTDPSIAYASHIHPVLDCLEVAVITTANPHTAESTLSNLPGVIKEGEMNHTPLLREKFLQSEKGNELYQLVLKYRFEVVELVNHCRPVTVVWHRGKGPAFLSHMVNNARDPFHPIPFEIDGVKRTTLIENMANVLVTHGSAELKAVIEAYREEVLMHMGRIDNLHHWVEQLDLVEV